MGNLAKGDYQVRWLGLTFRLWWHTTRSRPEKQHTGQVAMAPWALQLMTRQLRPETNRSAVLPTVSKLKKPFGTGRAGSAYAVPA